MKRLIQFLFLFSFTAFSYAEPLHLLSTIRPVHGIVGAIIQGTPHQSVLLLPGEASEHDYHLRPSDWKKIDQADLIIWVGPELETFLVGSFSQPKVEMKLLNLLTKTPFLLEMRFKMPFEAPQKATQHIDPHVWLDPRNAIAWAYAITERLSKLDPKNQALYQKNAKTFEKNLVTYLNQKNSLHTKYLAYHDAFQYFDAFFGSRSLGAIHSHLEDAHHASDMTILHQLLSEQGISRIGIEPYVQDPLAKRLAEQFDCLLVTLDPLGITLAESSDFYAQLLQYHLKALP